MQRRFALIGLPLLLVAARPGVCAAAQLISANSPECIDVPHGIAVDGTPPTLFPCHGSLNQQWSISQGHITGIGGLCLDVQGSVSSEGAQVIIVTCNGRPSQNWRVANGQIIGIGGRCLDVVGGSIADHAGLMLSTCSAAPSQQWWVQ
jgi:hypothetical protein